MAGTCTIYKSKNFGPKWSGTNELAAYFVTADGKGLGGSSSELIGAGGTSTYSVLIDPEASAQTQTASADTSDNLLTMDKYTGMAVYIVNSTNAEPITAQIWTCPPQPTAADRASAAAAITTGAAKRLESGATALDYGWIQEGNDIVIAQGTNDLSKFAASGGMLAVAIKAHDNTFDDANDVVKVYVVGEYA